MTKIDYHIPQAHQWHQLHNDAKDCGCWTGDEQEAKIVCPVCGAAYLLDEVKEFFMWRCYDCGAGWVTAEYLLGQKQRE